jgi:hypothetical protein
MLVHPAKLLIPTTTQARLSEYMSVKVLQAPQPVI